MQKEFHKIDNKTELRDSLSRYFWFIEKQKKLTPKQETQLEELLDSIFKLFFCNNFPYARKDISQKNDKKIDIQIGKYSQILQRNCNILKYHFKEQLISISFIFDIIE